MSGWSHEQHTQAENSKNERGKKGSLPHSPFLLFYPPPCTTHSLTHCTAPHLIFTQPCQFLTLYFPCVIESSLPHHLHVLDYPEVGGSNCNCLPVGTASYLKIIEKSQTGTSYIFRFDPMWLFVGDTKKAESVRTICIPCKTSKKISENKFLIFLLCVKKNFQKVQDLFRSRSWHSKAVLWNK
jgi:hypothetical protein